MPQAAIFVCEDSSREKAVSAMLRRLPAVTGAPVLIANSPGLRDRHGAVHAGSFVRQRRIAFDCTRSEFPRVFIHELFHFVWLRAGNAVRRAFEELLKGEWAAGARGELGWSSEWRKRDVSRADVERRTRRWREYCCEAFCDTAAWLYCGVGRHREFTLERRCRLLRRAWFRKNIEPGGLSI